MTRIINNSIILIIFICSLIDGPQAYAQSTCTPPQTRAWFIVQDAKGGIDTAWIGFDSSATRCQDPNLCDKDTPTPPPGFGFLFLRFWNDCYWGGTQQDYRPFTGSAQKDTFELNWGYFFDSTFFPLTLRWSKQTISQICDSARMGDIFNSIFSVDLTQTDSVIITNEIIQYVDIKVFGAKPLVQDKDYYPLQTKNEWFYRETTFSSAESDTGSVRVIGDSLFSNGHHYFILDKPDVTGATFIRADSQRVYYYNTTLEKDVQMFDFNADVGDTTNNDWLGYFSYVTITSIDTINVFGRESRIIKFKLDGLVTSEITFSEIFGPIKGEDYGDGGPWSQLTRDLIGCTIHNKTFGYTTSVNDEIRIPLTFSLEQNYPNPFNPTTNFEFQIANRGFVTLKVFNVLGEEIATILSEQLQPGRYTKSWDASTVAGGLSSGVYFYRLSTQNGVETKKMIYLE